MCENEVRKYPSPCLTCTRVADPRACDDKSCIPWQKWFLDRWKLIQAFPRKQMDQTKPEPVGVVIGGQHYAAPHQVDAYLQKDPCSDCLCGKEFCRVPCRVKRAWNGARNEVFL